MNKNKNRDQIEDKYKWDLSVLYASDNDWEEDYRKVEKGLPQLLEFRGRKHVSADVIPVIGRPFLRIRLNPLKGHFNP